MEGQNSLSNLLLDFSAEVFFCLFRCKKKGCRSFRFVKRDLLTKNFHSICSPRSKACGHNFLMMSVTVNFLRLPVVLGRGQLETHNGH